MKKIKQLAVISLLMAPFCVFAEPDTATAPDTVTTKTMTDAFPATEAVTTTTDSSAATAAANDQDPYEGYNRIMFDFNEHFDTLIAKPIARFYNAIMPRPLNEGVHNFFNNINTITTVANDLLQANFYQATNDTWRLGINSTVGVLGFFDIASRMQLKPYQNDFGLTLAKWGVTESNYLVLPILGPSTPRDLVGIPVDYFAFSVYPYVHPDSRRYGLLALSMIDTRAQLLKKQSLIDEVSLDKYTFVRNAYMQNRAYKIKQNEDRGYHPEDRTAPVSTVSAATVSASDADASDTTTNESAYE
jgi:phospholipid-binding lipoprotein MlaA